MFNIGGIANPTYLPREGAWQGLILGRGKRFDGCLIQRHQNLAFDADGPWAASGSVDSGPLVQLLSHPYFHSPLHTGKEEFTLVWLETVLANCAPIEVSECATHPTGANGGEH